MWEKYWLQFVKKASNAKQIGDGLLFENLVESLLQAKYGVRWTRTPKSHDDNRDFWLLTEDQRIWAECKNHHDKIAMDILAPTLVMAQVYDVNTILFFSRSPINQRAKDKILSFGEKSEKQIHFFDAQILENLIWTYRNQLPEQYRPPKECTPASVTKFSADLYFSQEAIVGVHETEERYVDYFSAEQVRYNETFGLSFFISNPFPDTPLHIKISFLKEESDRFHFQYLDKAISAEQDLWHERQLNGGEGCAIRLNMRPIKFMPILRLPGFLVEGNTAGKPPYQRCFMPIKIACRWIGQTKLIGHQYERILSETEELLVQNGKMSLLVLSGRSGTGKTRMLTECTNIFLKYGYSILSLTAAENFSSSYFLGEIVSFLYEIPSTQILKALEQKFAAQDAEQEEDTRSRFHTALNILREINCLQTEEELYQFIDTCGSLLFEKMSSRRCVLVMDNVQFAGVAFQHFLRQYTIYAANQNRPNRSAILCVFNQDYMTVSASELLFDLLHSNIKHLLSRKLSGFESDELGVLFLRELIHTGNERFDALFEAIIKRISLNPYHIFQTVRHLEENGAIKVTPEGQGYILEDDRAWELVSRLSRGIEEVLEKRQEFITRHLSEDRLFQICSVLFLFDKIDLELMRYFGLKASELQQLQQHGFLRTISSDVYVFDHDIIRNFFMTHHQSQLLVSLEWLRVHGDPDKLRGYPQIYDLYQIAIVGNDTYTYSVLTQLSQHCPSVRLSSFFYHRLFERCLDMDTCFQNKEAWIECLNDICKHIRSTDGSISAENCYAQAHRAIRERVGLLAYTQCAPAYRQFLHFYCDILVELHDRDAVEELVGTVLRESGSLVGANQICSDELNVLRAIMYNRWYVAYNNEYPTAAVRTKRELLMRRSRSAIPQIQNAQLKNLITYLNNSDEGYNFYGYKSDESQLLAIWDECLKGMPEAAPEKTLNYYRKRLQYDLIHHNFDDALDDLANGREYLENGEFSHEPLIFNTFFLMAEIMAYLQRRPIQSADYIERLLTELSQIQQILENGKMGDILLLRGVKAFYAKDADETYYAYHGAYVQYSKKKTSRYWIKTSLLLENIHLAFTELNIYSGKYDLGFLPQAYQTRLSEEALVHFHATGIQQTDDGQINLPLI